MLIMFSFIYTVYQGFLIGGPRAKSGPREDPIWPASKNRSGNCFIYFPIDPNENGKKRETHIYFAFPRPWLIKLNILSLLPV